MLQNLARVAGRFLGRRPTVTPTTQTILTAEEIAEKAQREKRMHRRRIESVQIEITARENFSVQIIATKPFLLSGQMSEFIMAVYGRVPTYLWYTAPTTDDWSNQEVTFLWGKRGPNFGDIEVHNRLRIRHAKVLEMELHVGGEVLKLEAIGYMSFSGPDLNDVPMLLEYVQDHDEPYVRFNQGTAELRAELASLLAQDI